MGADATHSGEHSQADAAAELAATLRTAATRGAERCGGAVLLFVCERGTDDPRLRAAAGVDSPEAARSAARQVAGAVAQAVEQGEAGQHPALDALGGAGTAGTRVLPLRAAARARGAMVVGTAEELGEEASRALAELADQIALRLECAALSRELEELRAQGPAGERAESGRSDEILKLSEQLFAQDIELLRKNEKLEKVEKLKNDFIEKMSRELRTPLNGIIEAIIAVLSGDSATLSESAQHTLRAALDDGTAFLRTLQNILDLWRIKQQELPVEIQEVNFREVVEEAIFSVQDALEGKPVRIEKRLSEPFPRIHTDLTKINQILFQLLDNAVKFTPQGTVEIAARIADGSLECEVRDSGIGICPDDQQFVFDEFYQVDELASTKYRGSGLGLALVRDLLILLDGEISLSSDAGKGSVFRFRLPVELAS